MNRKTLYAGSVALSILVFGLLGVSSQTEPNVSTKDVMKFKLHYAQGVMEGIATENFSLISTNALRLRGLSQAAAWQIRQTPEYQRFTSDYARQTEALNKAATNRNVDAATVAYFQLTVSCVNCHRYLRGAGTVQTPPPQQQIPALQTDALVDLVRVPSN